MDVRLIISIDSTTAAFLLSLLNHQPPEPQWAKDIMASQGRMEQMMQTLTEQLTSVKNELDTVKSDLVAITTGVSGLQGQLVTLNAKIVDLQTQIASGGVTPEAQAMLDSIVTEGADVQASADSLKNQFPPPTAPPTPAPQV